MGTPHPNSLVVPHIAYAGRLSRLQAKETAHSPYRPGKLRERSVTVSPTMPIFGTTRIDGLRFTAEHVLPMVADENTPSGATRAHSAQRQRRAIPGIGDVRRLLVIAPGRRHVKGWTVICVQNVTSIDFT